MNSADRTGLRIGAAAALLALAASASPAAARPVTVVELFTSQGCSSCPPANANFRTISNDPGILALSYAVTYWNRLGWVDTFSKEAYTARQVNYEGPLGHGGPFTPQIVVNGRGDVVGNQLGALKSLISGSGRVSGPAMDIAGGKVSIGEAKAPSGGADVWLVRYDPRTVTVDVKAGENSGRKLPHSHVVHNLQRLGSWSGEATSLKVPSGGGGMKTAVLVQTRNGGPILAAETE